MSKYNVIQMDYQGEITRWYQGRDVVRIEKSMTLIIKDGTTAEQAEEMIGLLKEKLMTVILMTKRG